MKKSILIIVVIFLGAIIKLNAQEKDSTFNRPAQISFIYPLGTNGLESYNYTNKLSLNMLAGFNGGVNGFEVAGLVNVLKYDMNGCQVAGIGNTIMGSSQGAQFAGLFNVNLKKANGLQIAGIINVSTDSIQGVQFAGITNICTSHTKGIQIAGIVNVSMSLNGLQLGFVNYVDSLEKGLPIGFISIVRKNGYKTIEVSANETMYANVSLKIGANKFYNIFAAGLKTENSDIIWGLGYGVGTIFPLSKKINLNIDLTANSMHYNSAWTNNLNILNKLSTSVEYRINKHIAVFAGASFNMHISNILDNNDETIAQIPVPYSTAEFSKNNILLRMYPGVSFGLRL